MQVILTKDFSLFSDAKNVILEAQSKTCFLKPSSLLLLSPLTEAGEAASPATGVHDARGGTCGGGQSDGV